MLKQIPGLYIAHIDEEKGRGVFAGLSISKGDIIEACPVIHIPKKDLQTIHSTALHDYYFLWGKDQDEAVIALGYGSLYNHSSDPNAQIILDYLADEIIIECVRKIDAGEEITIQYNEGDINADSLWFDPK